MGEGSRQSEPGRPCVAGMTEEPVLQLQEPRPRGAGWGLSTSQTKSLPRWDRGGGQGVGTVFTGGS